MHYPLTACCDERPIEDSKLYEVSMGLHQSNDGFDPIFLVQVEEVTDEEFGRGLRDGLDLRFSCHRGIERNR